MSIQNISSAPDYITKFISGNMEELCNIYEEGRENNPNGVLACNCSEEDNRMDVQFMNEKMLLEMITKESWEQLKASIPEDKKLLFIKDIDLNSIFLIYV